MIVLPNDRVEFQPGIMGQFALMIRNYTCDLLKNWHNFVGIEPDDEKFVGFIGVVTGDFDHKPYQDWKCPKCGSLRSPEFTPEGGPAIFAKCTKCEHEAKVEEWKIECSDLCPVCHPKKYSIIHAVKGCGNCQHFDVTGETETVFSDGQTPESLPDENLVDGDTCHGSLPDLDPCEFWKILTIECPACDTEHVGCPDYCGSCGARISVVM